MKITAAWLKERGACDTERFRKRFPRGVTLSVKNVRATRVAWDWNWLAHKVFTPASFDQFARNRDKAVNAYMKALEPHRMARETRYNAIIELYNSYKITYSERQRCISRLHDTYAKVCRPHVRTLLKAGKEAFIAALEAHEQEQRRARKRRRPQP